MFVLCYLQEATKIDTILWSTSDRDLKQKEEIDTDNNTRKVYFLTLEELDEALKTEESRKL